MAPKKTVLVSSVPWGIGWVLWKEEAKSFNYTWMLTSCRAACWLGKLLKIVSFCVCVCVCACRKKGLHCTRGNGDITP